MRRIIEYKHNSNITTMTKTLILEVDKAVSRSILIPTEEIIIPACNESRTFADAKDVFPSQFFEDDFWDKPTVATEEISAQVYKQMTKATFVQMFDSVGVDLNRLCLTQRQITSVCKRYPRLVRWNGYGVFFLLKEKLTFFIAGVIPRLGNVHLNVFQLRDSGNIWLANRVRHIVTPIVK
jgi:hypothetical protein